jgi:hypothetical protein
MYRTWINIVYMVAFCWWYSSVAWGDEPIVLANRLSDNNTARSRPDDIRYYETAIDRTPILTVGQQRFAQATVGNIMENGTQVLEWSSEVPKSIEDLDWAQVYAVYTVLELGADGLETDLRLSKGGQQPRIVSVYLESETVVRVSNSKAWSPLYPSTTVSKLRNQYGLQDVQSGSASWGPDEIAVLGDVLTYLTPKEQTYLQGVSFIRDRQRGRTGQAARYSFQSRNERTLQQVIVYDLAFKGQEYGFVGSLTRPNSVAHMVVLHELAHLLANQQLVMQEHILQGLIKEHNSMVSKYNHQNDTKLGVEIERLSEDIQRLQRNGIRGLGPMIEDFEKIRIRKYGPTEYANESLQEAFAESYALFKLDPEALERIDPSVHRWFASGAYLDLLPAD